MNGKEQNLKALQELKEMLLKPKPIELLYAELLANIGKKGERIEMQRVETQTVCLSTKMNISYIGRVHTSPMIIVHFFENNKVCMQEVGMQGRLYLDINEAVETFE